MILPTFFPQTSKKKIFDIFFFLTQTAQVPRQQPAMVSTPSPVRIPANARELEPYFKVDDMITNCLLSPTKAAPKTPTKTRPNSASQSQSPSPRKSPQPSTSASEQAKRQEYAGPAFQNSPAPDKLPVPSFVSKVSPPNSPSPTSMMAKTFDSTMSAPNSPLPSPSGAMAMSFSPLPMFPSLPGQYYYQPQLSYVDQTLHLKQLLNIPVA
jgi:hypothetical protein